MDFTRRIFIVALAIAIAALGTFLSMTPPEFTGARCALGAAAISLIVVYVSWVFSHPGMVRLQVAYGLFVALILVFGVIFGAKWIDYREQSYPKTPVYAGVLTPIKLVDKGNIGDVEIQIGNSPVYQANSGVLNDVITAWGTEQFTVTRNNGILYVSVKLKDENNNVIAEIENNEWKIRPPPGTWDRNYNQNALEVKDAQGNVVLQLRFVPGILQVQGAWWVDTGGVRHRLVMRDDKKGGAELIFCGVGKTMCSEIFPIFKYPSETHLGELLP